MYGMIEIREATKSQAAEIACLIMTAKDQVRKPF